MPPKCALLANSEEPDEMPHNGGISSGSPLFAISNIQRNVIIIIIILFFLVIIIYDLSIHTMEHPKFIVLN